MKKVICLVIAFMLMVGCGSQSIDSETASLDETVPYTSTPVVENKIEPNANLELLPGYLESLSFDDPDSVLSQLEKEFEESYTQISTSFDEVYLSLGDSYETYMNNCENLENWYTDTEEEMNRMYKRMEEMSIICARVIARAGVTNDKYDAQDAYINFNSKTLDSFEEYYLNVYNNLYDKILHYHSDVLIGYPEYSDKEELRHNFYKCIDEIRFSSWDRLQNNYYNILKLFSEGKTDIDSVIE